jgi:DnaJ-class molecular chaperone
MEYRPGLLKRTIRVTIPRNTTQGTVLRVQGMGRRNPAGAAGDLYVHVDIEGS